MVNAVTCSHLLFTGKDCNAPQHVTSPLEDAMPGQCPAAYGGHCRPGSLIR